MQQAVARPIAIASLAVLVICSCCYSYFVMEGATRTVGECLNGPAPCDGLEILVMDSIARNVSAGWFEVHAPDGVIMASGQTAGIEENDMISGVGIFRKGGYLEMADLHVHKLRREKFIVSLVPLALVVWIFYRNYRFDVRKLEFEAKGHA